MAIITPVCELEPEHLAACEELFAHSELRLHQHPMRLEEYALDAEEPSVEPLSPLHREYARSVAKLLRLPTLIDELFGTAEESPDITLLYQYVSRYPGSRRHTFVKLLEALIRCCQEPCAPDDHGDRHGPASPRNNVRDETCGHGSPVTCIQHDSMSVEAQLESGSDAKSEGALEDSRLLEVMDPDDKQHGFEDQLSSRQQYLTEVNSEKHEDQGSSVDPAISFEIDTNGSLRQSPSASSTSRDEPAETDGLSGEGQETPPLSPTSELTSDQTPVVGDALDTSSASTGLAKAALSTPPDESTMFIDRTSLDSIPDTSTHDRETSRVGENRSALWEPFWTLVTQSNADFATESLEQVEDFSRSGNSTDTYKRLLPSFASAHGYDTTSKWFEMDTSSRSGFRGSKKEFDFVCFDGGSF